MVDHIGFDGKLYTKDGSGSIYIHSALLVSWARIYLLRPLVALLLLLCLINCLFKIHAFVHVIAFTSVIAFTPSMP